MSNPSIVTKTGKNQLLYSTFNTPTNVNKFSGMALGTDGSGYISSSSTLNSECDPSAQTGYSRVTTVNTVDTNANRIRMEGVFNEDNISAETIIKEAGIVDSLTLGQGNFFCLCKIADITKTPEMQIRVVINITVV